MMKMKNWKPIHIYLLAILFFIVANLFDHIPAVYYSITVMGLICFIWAVLKYFRK